MEPLIQFLNDATLALNRASGLSTSLAKAAQGLLTLASETDFLQRVRIQQANSEEEVKRLREAGVRLYNAVKRGPTNDAYVLRLQLVACEAMVGAKGVGVSDDMAIVRTLDAMRCFSRVGILLASLSDKKYAMEALSRCVKLVGNDPLETIHSAFGTSQEAHDCGSALFAAICGMVTMKFEALDSGCAAGNERELILGDIRDILFSNTSFFSSIHVHAQGILRTMIEEAVHVLPIAESIPFQKWLFEEWETFSSTTSQVNLMIGIRLAFALAKSRNTNASIAVLERALALSDKMATADAVISFYLALAKCAVACCKLRDELKITRLVPSILGESLDETKSCLEERLSSLRQESLDLFNQVVNQVPLFDEAAFTLVLDLATDFYLLGETFEDTYGNLLQQLKGNTGKCYTTLLYILDHRTDSSIAWGASESGVALITSVVTQCDQGQRAAISRKIWNNLCTTRSRDDWFSSAAYAKLLLAVAKDDVEMVSRALQVSALANMHLELPDKNGIVENEIKVLRSAHDNAVRARLMLPNGASCVARSATIIELKCQVRLSAIDPSVNLGMVVTRVRETLHLRQLEKTQLVEVASDASSIGAHNTAITILETVREAYKWPSGDGREEPFHTIVKELFCEHLRAGKLCDAADDVTVYVNHIDTQQKPSLSVDEVAFRKELFKLLLSRVSLEVRTGITSLEQALPIFALIRSASLVSNSSEEREHIIACALGFLIESCLQIFGKTDKPKEDDLRLIAFAGEKASELLHSLTPEFKQSDSRHGIIAVFASMFMAATIQDADEDVAERIVNICDDGEYAFPQKRGLEATASIARKLGMFKTARQLLVRVAQYELSANTPNYDRVVSRCLICLLADADDPDDVRAWIGQISNIASSTQLNPITLEQASLAVWRKSHIKHDRSALANALSWLNEACHQSSEIFARRQRNLESMKAAFRQFDQSAPSQRFRSTPPMTTPISAQPGPDTSTVEVQASIDASNPNLDPNVLCVAARSPIEDGEENAVTEDEAEVLTE